MSSGMVDIIFSDNTHACSPLQTLYAAPADEQGVQAAGENSGPDVKCPRAKSCNCEQGVLYRVLLITLIIWFGIGAYLFYLNKKIVSLEKKLDEL